MFFAYMAMRPAAAKLEPPIRLALWADTFSRFFPWVWLAVIALPATGYYLVQRLFGGLHGAPISIHIMHGVGWVMVGIYSFVYFRQYRHLTMAVEMKDFPLAGQHLATIRTLMATNLVLGIVVIGVAAGGRG